MAFHVEYVDAELPENLHRQGNYGETLEAALSSTTHTFAKRPTLAAWMLEAEHGNIGYGQGRIVAVYTPEHGWETLETDPRQWWNKLSEEAQQGLMDSDSWEIPAAHTREIIESGAGATRGYFVQNDDSGGWSLQSTARAFVETVKRRRGAL